jgi:hypothetical protein
MFSWSGEVGYPLSVMAEVGMSCGQAHALLLETRLRLRRRSARGLLAAATRSITLPSSRGVGAPWRAVLKI